MYYFRFIIPKQDGNKTVAYSPGWHGTMPKCPKNVTVLMYNDNESYGIAKTKDTFIPPEVIVSTQKKATDLVKATPEIEGVWKGENIKHIWDEEVTDGK